MMDFDKLKELYRKVFGIKTPPVAVKRKEGERFCPATSDVVTCQDDCLACGKKDEAMSWPPTGWVRVGSGLGRDQFGGPGELEIALEKAAQTLIKGLKEEAHDDR